MSYCPGNFCLVCNISVRFFIVLVSENIFIGKSFELSWSIFLSLDVSKINSRFIVLFFLRWTRIKVSFGLVLLLCLRRFLPDLLGFFGRVIGELVFFSLGLDFLGFHFIDLIVGNVSFIIYFTLYQLLYLWIKVIVIMENFKDYYSFEQNQ